MKTKQVDIEAIEEDDSELRKARVAFCASLYHDVMKENPANAKKWEDWATIALNHYEKNEARYLDDLEINQVLKGRWRPSFPYLNKASTRSAVTTYLSEMGVWVFTDPFRGVRLALTMVEVEMSHRRQVRSIKGRGDKASYRAIRMNEHGGVELPVVAVQAFLPRSS